MSLGIIATLVLVAGLQQTSLAQKVSDCSIDPADIVFILDSSTSIWRPDFKKQVQFVRNVTESFDIGPGASQTRIAAVSFGHKVWPKFNLKDFLDPTDLRKAIGKIKHDLGLRTKTGAGIQYAVDYMFNAANGSRSYATQLAVVITDGRSQRLWETVAAAKNAHAAGIKVFAIGVGKKVDTNELRQIASDPSYVFNVTNYNALLSFTKSFAEETCKVTVAPVTRPPTTTTQAPIKDITCEGKPADVFFIIDASSSITRKDFSKELDFIQKVVQMFDLGQHNTRVGTITFSNEARLDIRLDNGLSKDVLLKKILKLNQPGGGTNTGGALKMARIDGFASDVARPNVAKIAVVLTDGLSRDDEDTMAQAKMLHESGVTTFAIGIGHGIDLVEIRAIASDPDEQYAYQVGDFNSLDSIKDLLATKACSVKPATIVEKPKDQPECEVHRTTDLMFIYDTSALGSAQSTAISKLVASIVARLDFTGGHLHVGRVTDNCPTGGNFALTSRLSAIDFSNIRVATFSTLIKKVRRSGFSSEYGGRENATKVGVLFVDSRMGNVDNNALEEAKALSKKSELFVVTIGSSPYINRFKSEFSQRNVVSINSYLDLNKAVEKLLSRFCLHLNFLDYNIDYVIPV